MPTPLRTSLRTAAVLVVAGSLLTGCSLLPTPTPGSDSQPSSQAPALDAAPATGETISGEAYTYVVPEGWAVPPQDFPGFDSLAANLQDADGFADNVNVIKSPVGLVTNEQVESEGVTELETAGATDIAVNERVVVADSESAHLTATMSSEGVSYVAEQYYASTDDQTYIVTFSFSDTVPAAERQEIAESILVTWTWS